jgi:hypothetical protein
LAGVAAVGDGQLGDGFRLMPMMTDSVDIVPFPGVDVLITIIFDFCQFSAKNWRFSQKPML